MQLTLNTFQIVYAFLVLCYNLRIEVRTSLFYSLFMIKRHSYGQGWSFIRPCHDRKFIKGLPFAIHEWKPCFFFLSNSQSWGFHTKWREAQVTPNDGKKVLQADQEDFEKLLELNYLQWRSN